MVGQLACHISGTFFAIFSEWRIPRMLDSISGVVCVAFLGGTLALLATLWQHELGRRNRASGRKSQSKSRQRRFHDTPYVPRAYIQLLSI